MSEEEVRAALQKLANEVSELRSALNNGLDEIWNVLEKKLGVNDDEE